MRYRKLCEIYFVAKKSIKNSKNLVMTLLYTCQYFLHKSGDIFEFIMQS